MPSKQTNLTQAKITKFAAKAPQKTFTVADSKQRGLVLRVSDKGAVTWSVYAWDRTSKRPRRQKIGPWGKPGVGWTVTAARIKAQAILAEWVTGEVKNLTSKVLTLGEIARSHTERSRAKGRRIPNNLEHLIKLGSSGWLGKPLDSITPEDVDTRHTEIFKQRGPIAGSNWVRALRALYKAAQRPPHRWTGMNPTDGVEVQAVKPRSRILTRPEITRLRASINMEPEPWRDLFTLILLTGARRGNVMRMQFANLDLESGWWSVSGEQSKTGDPLRIRLLPDAVALLRDRADMLGSEGYVFPSNKKDSPHVAGPWNEWKVVRDRAGIPDITLHDLRRTVGSLLLEAGVPLPTVSAVLGHKNTATTAKYYAVATDKAVTDAMGKYESILNGEG